jgi:hypothetical protein
VRDLNTDAVMRTHAWCIYAYGDLIIYIIAWILKLTMHASCAYIYRVRSSFAFNYLVFNFNFNLLRAHMQMQLDRGLAIIIINEYINY